MERRDFIKTTSVLVAGVGLPFQSSGDPAEKVTPDERKRKLFIYGGQFNQAFTKYVIGLTEKKDPKVCFLPTASGDSAGDISYWLETIQGLELRPFVQRSFRDQSQSFESLLLDVDAIIVGGGNALSLVAVWRALGIDSILRKAYENGTVISGGSAGSMCWFEHGLTNAIPPAFTKFDGLNWIRRSHCPHYDSVGGRKILYHEMIIDGRLSPGYACDDSAGIYFENEEFKKAVSTDAASKSYYVDVVEKKIREKELGTEVIK